MVDAKMSQGEAMQKGIQINFGGKVYAPHTQLKGKVFVDFTETRNRSISFAKRKTPRLETGKK